MLHEHAYMHIFCADCSVKLLMNESWDYRAHLSQMLDSLVSSVFCLDAQSERKVALFNCSHHFVLSVSVKLVYPNL